MTQPTLLYRLAASVEAVRTAPPSPATVDKTKICLLDYFAAACAGAATVTGKASADMAASFGPGPCTLIGRTENGSAAAASLHNGLLGHAEELDDSHRYVAGMHQGVTTIPVALALAEESGASGETFLRAVLCGYEASGRIIRCINKEHRARGFHATGTIGSFGAAAAAAVMLNLDMNGLATAMGLAASTAAGIFAFLENGATVKHLHAGRPPLDGLVCALLARGGMTAPDTVFEAKEGFFHAYATGYDPTPLDADLGAPEITCAYHKIHSACGHSFPAIDAALALREMLTAKGLSPEDLEQATFKTYKTAADLVSRDPKTTQEARFSLPFLFALALQRGSVSRADITEETVGDANVRAIMPRIAILEDAAITESFPRLRAGELTATTKNGHTFTHRIDSPRGMPDNPVGLDVIEEKFRTEAKALLRPETVETVIGLVRTIDTAPSIRPLAACFRGH